MKKIVCILLTFLIIAPQMFAAANPPKIDVKTQLQQILNKKIVGNSTPGAVISISSPTLHNITLASGYSNLASRSVMTTANNFRIASMSKTFLAVLVLKLCEQKKLKLDDTIAKLLPHTVDAHRIANANIVTIRELLQMRSGIPNYISNPAYGAMLGRNKILRPEDVVKVIYDEKSSFAPGERFEYSNTNYILLQMIVENLTHTTLAQQLRQAIFIPLNLQKTYQEVQEKKTNGYHGLLTHGYDYVGDKIKDVTTENDGFGLGDGGVISTANDMQTFIQSLLDTKKLLKTTSLQQMLMFTEDYGLGIAQNTIAKQLVFTHSGHSSGFSGEYYYFPNLRMTIIILTNSTESEFFDGIVQDALKLLGVH